MVDRYYKKENKYLKRDTLLSIFKGLSSHSHSMLSILEILFFSSFSHIFSKWPNHSCVSTLPYSRVCHPYMCAPWKTHQSERCCCMGTWQMQGPLCWTLGTASCTGQCGALLPWAGSQSPPVSRASSSAPGWMAHIGNLLSPKTCSGPTVWRLTSRRVTCTGVTATTEWLQGCGWMAVTMRWAFLLCVCAMFLSELPPVPPFFHSIQL